MKGFDADRMGPAIREEPESSGRIWISYRRPRPEAKMRLFCFPFAGGGASTFSGWAKGLPEDIEVLPVQLPGRENRMGEPLFRSMTELVGSLATGLRPWLDRPYALFGHSMGALVAFELAREWRARGASGPAHIFLSGRCAPQLTDDRPNLHGLPEPELKRELRRLQGTPAEVLENREIMSMLLPRLRADFEICETYRFRSQAPLETPLTAYCGSSDPESTLQMAAGWKEHTKSGFSVREFSGGHFFLLEEKAALWEDIKTTLAEIRLNPFNRVGGDLHPD